jgi:hypothetical protein
MRGPLYHYFNTGGRYRFRTKTCTYAEASAYAKSSPGVYTLKQPANLNCFHST